MAQPIEGGGVRVTARQKMLGDLVGKVLPNRTRSQILELLGKPQERAGFTELCYPLGYGRDGLSRAASS